MGTPWPPNFNVEALATRGPLALAIIYVVGRGLNSRGNIEIRGPRGWRAGELGAQWQIAHIHFTCEISAFNSSVQWVAWSRKGPKAPERPPQGAEGPLTGP